MNHFGTTQFDAPVLLTQPASLPQHPVRYGEFLSALSGTLPGSHTHHLADLVDWPAVGPYLAAVLADTLSVQWSEAAGVVSADVILQPGGGIVQTPTGLAVDLTGIAAAVTHTHLLADITDFTAQLPARVYVLLSGTNTISAATDGAHITFNVNRKTNGGLLEDAGGLYVDLGTGATQAAPGNHTHLQLHDPVTLLSGSNTLNLSLTGQQLGGEVKLDPAGGLTVWLSGVGANFGTGSNQIARGDHTHALLHNPVTTVSTPALSLSVDVNQQLSGTVRVDLAPGVNRGKVGIGVNGLYVALGTTVDTAAAGNHGHTVATPATDGFLSAVDKQKLDLLVAAALLSGAYQSVGVSLEGSALVGEYLLGRYQWENRMRLMSAQVVGKAAPVNTVLEMEVAGVLTGQQLTLPSGAAFPEREGSATYASFYINPGDKLRVKVVNGATIDNAAFRLEVNLQLRPG